MGLWRPPRGTMGLWRHPLLRGFISLCRESTRHRTFRSNCNVFAFLCESVCVCGLIGTLNVSVLSFYSFTFSFWLGGHLGATLLSCLKSGFIRHMPPPPCHLSSTSGTSKPYTWGAPVGKSLPLPPWPWRPAPWVYPKKVWWWYCQGKGWWEGSEYYNETDHSEQTDPDWSGTFWLGADYQSLQVTTKR